jgi:hypothetical protein
MGLLIAKMIRALAHMRECITFTGNGLLDDFGEVGHGLGIW